MPPSPFRQLPQVSKVLAAEPLAAARATHPPAVVTAAVRAELAALRTRIAAGEAPPLDVERVAAAAADRLTAAPQLREVINATGVTLHTNLGRAPLAESAALAAYHAARGYLNLELDLATGKRASRQDAVRAGICRLTGAAAATAVNNCAAATVLVLRALAAGKEVVVSRGQLIEIGGSFRLPDIMAASGAILREVGTTNITRLADYEAAVGPSTGLILRVHTSNYRVRGFTKSVPIAALAAIGKKHGVPVVDDAGSGLAAGGFGAEPTIAAGLSAGADLVMFSGDKLLGGPQAGIIAGRADLVKRLEKDPLMRAFRLDKMTLAAVAATLDLYARPHPEEAIPTLRMLTTPIEQHRTRTEAFAERLRAIQGLTLEVRDDVTFAGGGSLPDTPLPTVVLALACGVSETEFARRLRTGTPAVVGRVAGGRVLLDLRCVFERQEEELMEAVKQATQSPGMIIPGLSPPESS